MEYDDESSSPLQGAFYASASYHKPIFNYFREEEKLDLNQILKPENNEVEDFILKDNNLVIIKHNPEFATNKNPDTPTNRLSTSLLSKDRLAFVLKYAITYVKENDGLQKHIMRYPQIFATKAIENKLGCKIEKNMMPIQAGDVPATYADVSDLVKDLGYKPATPIQEGVDKFVDWYLDFFKVESR
jgi:type I restriction enzyme R subunit